MHTGKRKILCHCKKALEAFKKMATSATVRRENATHWRGFWRGVKSKLSTPKQTAIISTDHSRKRHKWWRWQIMIFTSLFCRPPNRDVLMRFFKASSLLMEVTFNFLFNFALYNEWTIGAHSTATSDAEWSRTSNVVFLFPICIYTARYTEKSLLQVWGTNFTAVNVKWGQYIWSVEAVGGNKGARIRN